MKRTTSIITLVLATLAVAAAPAAASEGYRSLDGIVASQAPQPTLTSTDYRSLDGIVASQAPQPTLASTDYRSLDGIVASQAPQPTLASTDYRSLDGIVASQAPQPAQVSVTALRTPDQVLGGQGSSPTQPAPVVQARGGDGFHWGDALIGALIASGLLLTGLAAARSVTRHRRTAAESRA